MRKILKNKKGEGYINICVFILCMMFIVVLIINVVPVFITKHQLDIFVTELCREAEIAGEVGAETTARQKELEETLGIEPTVSWNKTGKIQLKIQLNEEITVTATIEQKIGGFADLTTFTIQLRAKASGKSEVYHK